MVTKTRRGRPPLGFPACHDPVRQASQALCPAGWFRHMLEEVRPRRRSGRTWMNLKVLWLLAGAAVLAATYFYLPLGTTTMAVPPPSQAAQPPAKPVPEGM